MTEKKDEAGLSKAKAHEKTPFPIVQKRGEKGSVGSLTQTPMAPKKNKKEKVPKPREESFEHLNFHLSFELNGEVHSLILPLNGPKKGKMGK